MKWCKRRYWAPGSGDQLMLTLIYSTTEQNNALSSGENYNADADIFAYKSVITKASSSWVHYQNILRMFRHMMNI